MERLKIHAFLREFPFLTMDQGQWDSGQLDPIVMDIDLVQSVRVSRISHEFLRLIPHSVYEDNKTTVRQGERIFLLNNKGYAVRRVRQAIEEDGQKGESVEEALMLLPCPSVVAWVVNVTSTRDPRTGLYSHSVVVYKPPKNFTLENWREKLLQREQALIQAEVAEIDAEGITEAT